MCIAVCVFYMMIRALVFTGSTCGLIYSLALRTFGVRGIRFSWMSTLQVRTILLQSLLWEQPLCFIQPQFNAKHKPESV